MFPEFDTDLCLFLCNKWDLVSIRKQKRTELMQTIMSKLQEPWLTVQQGQIITFSCKEKVTKNVLQWKTLIDTPTFAIKQIYSKELTLNKVNHSSQLRLIPYLHHTSSVLR